MAKNEPIWWVNQSNDRVRTLNISPYYKDVHSNNDMLSKMASLEQTLAAKNKPLTPETKPDELRWQYTRISKKERDLPDFGQVYMGTILISQSMKELLEKFDLGDSQVLELPLFDASKVYPGDLAEADRTKTDPRRWFLLHILEQRDAFRPELCVGLHNSAAKLADKPPRWSINHDVPPELMIDPGAVGAGALWRDPKAPQFLFFSDALKREIKAQKMKARLLVFNQCKFAT